MYEKFVVFDKAKTNKMKGVNRTSGFGMEIAQGLNTLGMISTGIVGRGTKVTDKKSEKLKKNIEQEVKSQEDVDKFAMTFLTKKRNASKFIGFENKNVSVMKKR